MSQKKRPQRVYGTLDYLELEVQRRLREDGIKIPHDLKLTRLMLMARDMRKEVLQALVIIKDVFDHWHAKKHDQASLARDFLLNNNFVVQRKGGKLMLATDLLDTLTPADFEADGKTLKRHIRERNVKDLSDDEISVLLGRRFVSTHSVKKARQMLAKGKH